MPCFVRAHAYETRLFFTQSRGLAHTAKLVKKFGRLIMRLHIVTLLLLYVVLSARAGTPTPDIEATAKAISFALPVLNPASL